MPRDFESARIEKTDDGSYVVEIHMRGEGKDPFGKSKRFIANSLAEIPSVLEKNSSPEKEKESKGKKKPSGKELDQFLEKDED